MLDRPGGRLGDGRSDDRRAVRGDDDPRRASALGAPAHRTEVARVGDPVEADEEREVLRGELPAVRVPVRLRPRDDALMVARPGGLGEPTLELDLHLDGRLAQPRLRGDRALARPELEHLATAPQRLAHRAAAVDLIASHCRGTSSKPPATSRTTQPDASIWSRNASPSAK